MVNNREPQVQSFYAYIDVFLDALADRVVSRLATKIEPHATTKPAARLLSVEQAAAYLGRTPEAMQHLISGGKVPVVRSDRRVFLDIEDLDRWVEQNKQGGN